MAVLAVTATSETIAEVATQQQSHPAREVGVPVGKPAVGGDCTGTLAAGNGPVGMG